MKPVKSTMPVLKQIVEFIPAYLVSKLARPIGANQKQKVPRLLIVDGQ